MEPSDLRTCQCCGKTGHDRTVRVRIRRSRVHPPVELADQDVLDLLDDPELAYDQVDMISRYLTRLRYLVNQIEPPVPLPCPPFSIITAIRHSLSRYLLYQSFLYTSGIHFPMHSVELIQTLLRQIMPNSNAEAIGSEYLNETDKYGFECDRAVIFPFSQSPLEPNESYLRNFSLGYMLKFEDSLLLMKQLNMLQLHKENPQFYDIYIANKAACDDCLIPGTCSRVIPCISCMLINCKPIIVRLNPLDPSSQFIKFLPPRMKALTYEPDTEQAMHQTVDQKLQQLDYARLRSLFPTENEDPYTAKRNPEPEESTPHFDVDFIPSSSSKACLCSIVYPNYTKVKFPYIPGHPLYPYHGCTYIEEDGRTVTKYVVKYKKGKKKFVRKSYKGLVFASAFFRLQNCRYFASKETPFESFIPDIFDFGEALDSCHYNPTYPQYPFLTQCRNLKLRLREDKP